MNGSNGAVTERVIRLVRQLMESPATLPDPFPVHQQLSDLGLSSLKMVNLMLSVEMEFDLMIPQTEITPENFHSVTTIAQLLARMLPSGPAEPA